MWVASILEVAPPGPAISCRFLSAHRVLVYPAIYGGINLCIGFAVVVMEVVYQFSLVNIDVENKPEPTN